MNPEDEQNDPVWKLLGEARPQEPGPFFARNVVREVRKLQDDTRSVPGFWSALFAKPAWLGAAAAVAIAIAMVFLINPKDNPVVDGSDPAAVDVPIEAALSVAELDEEIDSLDYLDELLAVQDTALLSDDDIAALLF